MYSHDTFLFVTTSRLGIPPTFSGEIQILNGYENYNTYNKLLL